MGKKPRKESSNAKSTQQSNVVQNDNSASKSNSRFDKTTRIIELGVILIALVFAFLELKKITEQNEIQTEQITKQYIWNKKDATFRYLDGYTESLRNTTDNLPILLQTDSIEIVFQNKEQKVKIMNLVGYFENLAIGIENDYFDNDIAISSLYRQALIVYDELTEHRYFTVREQEVGRPTAKNFRKLAEEWKGQ